MLYPISSRIYACLPLSYIVQHIRFFCTHAGSWTYTCGLHIKLLASPALLQDVTQTASKQARLEREEVDVVSTSLPTPAVGTSRVDAQIRASIAQAGLDATTTGAQPDSPSADQSDVQHPSGRGTVDLLGDSSKAKLSISPGKQNQGLLSSFLGDYGSDSDGSNEQAT